MKAPPMKETIVFEIKALNNQIRRFLDRNMVEYEGETFTGMQIGFIGFLAGAGYSGQPVYQRDVEAEFNIRRPTATGILQLMEKKGLIRRESVSHDARLKQITLTDKGEAVSQRAKANMVKLETRIIKGVSPEDLACFHKVVNQLADNISE